MTDIALHGLHHVTAIATDPHPAGLPGLVAAAPARPREGTA